MNVSLQMFAESLSFRQRTLDSHGAVANLQRQNAYTVNEDTIHREHVENPYRDVGCHV